MQTIKNIFGTFGKLLWSRKFWVGVFTAGATAGVSQMNLPPAVTVMLMKAIAGIGVFLIGGIAYEDGKTKQFGQVPPFPTPPEK